MRPQIQIRLCRPAAKSRPHDCRSRHLQERDFEAGQGRKALRSAQGPRRLLPLRAAQACSIPVSGNHETGRRRGRRRASPKSTKASSGASRTMRMPTPRWAFRPTIVSSRKTARSCLPTSTRSRPRQRRLKPALRQPSAHWRKNMSGTRSGSAASSISQPSVRRCGWCCFRWSAARNAMMNIQARSAGCPTSCALSAGSFQT